jgi:hypothetical protein
MMKATTEATKLNFITDQGSSRERVSIAWRLFDRRTVGPRLPLLALRSLRRCRKPDTEPDTEPASPAAAPVSPAAAAVAVEEKPDSDGALRVPVPLNPPTPFGEPAPFGAPAPTELPESAASCQAERP